MSNMTIEQRALGDRIRAIPSPEGFWRRDTYDAFATLAMWMKDRGATDDFIIDALTELYHACGSEYGD